MEDNKPVRSYVPSRHWTLSFCILLYSVKFFLRFSSVSRVLYLSLVIAKLQIDFLVAERGGCYTEYHLYASYAFCNTRFVKQHHCNCSAIKPISNNKNPDSPQSYHFSVSHSPHPQHQGKKSVYTHFRHCYQILHNKLHL